MPFRNKLTKEDQKNIEKWLEEGVKLREIVKRVDNKVSCQRIQQIAEKLDIRPALIRKEKIEKERNDLMFAKWGPQWQDKEWRKSAIYQAMREKFFNKKKNSHKHEFSIDFGDLSFPTHCPILNIELDYFNEIRSENSPSFDRIDPSKGYIKGNVAIVSWRANRIKNNGTAEEHRKIADFMQQFSSGSS